MKSDTYFLILNKFICPKKYFDEKNIKIKKPCGGGKVKQHIELVR